jgi:hypothetical protein
LRPFIQRRIGIGLELPDVIAERVPAQLRIGEIEDGIGMQAAHGCSVSHAPADADLALVHAQEDFFEITEVRIDADTVVGFWPIRNVDVSLARLKNVLAEHKMAGACICSARGIWYDFAEGNEETLALARDDPQLIPVMTVDPRRFIGCRDEIRRRTQEGYRLFRLFPEYQGWPVDAPSVRALLGHLEGSGAILMLGGSATQAVPVVSGLQTPVILTGCHFYQLSDVLAEAGALPNVFVTTRFLIGPGSLDIAAHALGASRLIFGSHAPLEYMAPSLRLVDVSALEAGAKAAVLGGNLLRLLGG